MSDFPTIRETLADIKTLLHHDGPGPYADAEELLPATRDFGLEYGCNQYVKLESEMSGDMATCRYQVTLGGTGRVEPVFDITLVMLNHGILGPTIYTPRYGWPLMLRDEAAKAKLLTL